MNRKWISIEEKTPKEGQIILAFPGYISVSIGKHTVNQSVHELIYHRGCFWDWRDFPLCCGLNQIVHGITHWMPMPPTPKD